MKRLFVACGLLLAGVLCASAFWQSRDSNYNKNIAVGGGSLSCSYTPNTTATQLATYTGGTPSASGGTPGYTYSESGTLPTGLSTTAGVISGKVGGAPGNAGAFTGIQISVMDSASNTANCGSSFTLTVAYQGPGDVATAICGTFTAWYGVRAFNNTLANAGASTTPVMDVRGVTTSTSCTIYLLGNGTGELDFSTAGAGAVGHQCLLGATTFCTSTNTNCTVSKFYTYPTPDTACGGSSCAVVQATTGNQPPLIMPGSCSYPNSTTLVPCLKSTSATILLASANNFTPNGAFQWTASAVAQRTSGTGTGGFIWMNGSSAQGIAGDASANLWQLYVASSSQAPTTATDAAWHAGNGVAVAGTNTTILNVDGTEVTATKTPNATAGTPIWVRAGATTTAYYAEGGWLDNFVASQSNRTSLCANQAAYYGTSVGTYC